MIKFRYLIFKRLFWFLLFIIISFFVALMSAFIWWLVANGSDKVVSYTFCWKWSFIVLSGLSFLERIITMVHNMYLATIFHLKYKVPGKGLALAILEREQYKRDKNSKENFIQWLKTYDWDSKQPMIKWQQIVFEPFV